MVYTFRDILDDKLYTTARVIFITGNISIFNNLVVDRIKRSCKGNIDGMQVNEELLEEFGFSSDSGKDKYIQDDQLLNFVDFEEFIELSKMPSVVGKWYCDVDYDMLSDRQKNLLEEYSKRPNEYGVMVVRSTIYKNYRPHLKSKTYRESQYSHLIGLSFPTRETLNRVVKLMFNEHNMDIDDWAIKLFISRIKDKYNSYIDIINRLEVTYAHTKIDYNILKNEMKDIENYVFDDFIKELVIPMKGKGIRVSRKVYKIQSALLEEYTPKVLVQKLGNRVEEIIEMRLLMNKGMIPVGVTLDIEDIQRRIGDISKLSKVSKYKFKSLYEQAQLTSLRDWLYIKLIINTVTQSVRKQYEIGDIEWIRVLHAVVNRSTFSEYRLLNILGIEDSLRRDRGIIDRLYNFEIKEYTAR